MGLRERALHQIDWSAIRPLEPSRIVRNRKILHLNPKAKGWHVIRPAYPKEIVSYRIFDFCWSNGWKEIPRTELSRLPETVLSEMYWQLLHQRLPGKLVEMLLDAGHDPFYDYAPRLYAPPIQASLGLEIGRSLIPHVACTIEYGPDHDRHQVCIEGVDIEHCLELFLRSALPSIRAETLILRDNKDRMEELRAMLYRRVRGLIVEAGPIERDYLMSPPSQADHSISQEVAQQLDQHGWKDAAPQNDSRVPVRRPRSRRSKGRRRTALRSQENPQLPINDVRRNQVSVPLTAHDHCIPMVRNTG